MNGVLYHVFGHSLYVDHAPDLRGPVPADDAWIGRCFNCGCWHILRSSAWANCSNPECDLSATKRPRMEEPVQRVNEPAMLAAYAIGGHVAVLDIMAQDVPLCPPPIGR